MFSSGAAAASGAAASLAVAFATDAVFGSSGGHVFAAKVALCSSLLACAHYAQTIFSHVGDGGGGTEEDHFFSSRKNRNHHHSEAGGGGSGLLLGTALPAGLSALYCAGLFSNSFIEAEDGLHRFLGASSLVSLSVLFLLLRGRRTGTGNGTGDPDHRRRGDHSGAGLSLPFGMTSPMSAAALHAGLAAALLRAAAAVQETAAEAGVSTEATFGVARSLLPLPALWYLCMLARHGGGGSGGGRGVLGALFGLDCRRCFHGVLQALSLAAVGLYWTNEAASAATAPGAGKDHGAVGEGASDAVVGRDDGGQGSPSAAATVAEASSGLLPPMRLLLPRAVYLLCLVGLAAALLRPAGRWRRRRPQQDPLVESNRRRGRDWSGKDGGKQVPAAAAPGSVDEERGGAPPPSYARALAATAGTVVSHLLPVVVLLLGAGLPAAVAFVSAACGCILRGVSIAAVAASASASASAGASPGAAALPLGAVAVVWSVVGRAFFFLTGHHNQFSRLQYSAAFVGESASQGWASMTRRMV